MADPGKGPGGPGAPPPLFLDQNEVRKAETIFFFWGGGAGPLLSLGRDDPPPPPLN